MTRTDQHPHQIRGEDLTAGRRGTEAGGFDDGSAVDIVVLEGDVPEGDTDPHGQRCGVVAAAVVPVDRLLDRCSRRHGLRRGGEGGHDPVTEPLDHPAGMRLDGCGQQAVVHAPQVLGGPLTEARAQFG